MYCVYKHFVLLNQIYHYNTTATHSGSYWYYIVTYTPRGLPGLQRSGCRVVERDLKKKKIVRIHAYTQCFLL